MCLSTTKPRYVFEHDETAFWYVDYIKHLLVQIIYI